MYDLSSGRSVYRLQLDSRRKQKRVDCRWFVSRFLLLFSVDFQERHRQIPDVGRGEQIVGDKQIVGADELFAKREPRDVSLTWR